MVCSGLWTGQHEQYCRALLIRHLLPLLLPCVGVSSAIVRRVLRVDWAALDSKVRSAGLQREGKCQGLCTRSSGEFSVYVSCAVRVTSYAGSHAANAHRDASRERKSTCHLHSHFHFHLHCVGIHAVYSKANLVESITREHPQICSRFFLCVLSMR